MRRPPNAPPKVISHKELLNRAQGVQCYDAIPVNEPEDAQAEVEKFIPMLEEYLKRTLNTVSRVAHIINICCFPPLYRFSVGHPTYNIRRLVCKRLCLGHFLPPNLKVHGLEQDLSEHRNAVRLTLRFGSHGLTFHSESTGLPASFGDPDESDPESEVEDEGDEDSNGQFSPSATHPTCFCSLTRLSSRRLVHKRLPRGRCRFGRRCPSRHW